MRAGVVLFILPVLIGYAFPADAHLTMTQPIVQDPESFPSNKAIYIREGSKVSLEEALLIKEWIWPFMDDLPEKVYMSVTRLEADRWSSTSRIHIFLLDGDCILGTGEGQTFSVAIQGLVRNLLRQGYLIKERLVTIQEPRVCETLEQNKEDTP